MTPESTPEEISAESLRLKLADILENWPLYRQFTYRGKKGHYVNERSHNRSRFGFLPERISLYCPHCQNYQQWQVNGSEVYFKSDKFKKSRYECRNCGKRSVSYFFYWEETEEGGIFMKVGQFPPLSHRPPKELAKRLDREDFDFYVKALDCRNFGYGLAALAYLRRVVENRINDLLDLIRQVAEEQALSEERLQEINQVKERARFEEKLELAEKLIPSRLIPQGFNPIGSLYKLASGGIHQESEDECIDIFDPARLAFEYLFSQLDHEKLAANKYVESLKALEVKSGEYKLSRDTTESV